MARRPRFDADSDRQRQVVAAFLEATASGDLPALLRTLDPAVMLLADGGGKAPAAGRPVHGPRKVAQVLLGGFRWYPGMTGRLIPVNGGAGVVVNYAGRVIALAGLIVAGDRITEIDLVVNPDKLRRFAAGA